jgi:hypothetical protein
MVAGTRCEHPFFHIQVRYRDTEFLTRDQWLIVADRIERILGLAGQPRAIAFHTDRRTGGEHMHLAFSRIDHESLTARKLPFFKRRLNTVSRELEAELGLTPVRADRASLIKYAPLRSHEEQGRRLGVDIRDLLETIRACFDNADCGRGFAGALAHNQMTLAQGERRDFVVIDHAGGVHAIGKRILGVSAALIRARLSDLVRESLPTVNQVRQRISTVQSSRKKNAIESDKSSGHKQQRRPAPAIQISAPSLRKAQATEDEEDWAARPIPSEPMASQPQTISPGSLPLLSNEDAPETPIFEFEQSEAAPPKPAPLVSTETDPARNHAEPEVGNEQSTSQKSAGLADVLKKQFRALVKVLVKRTASPRPQARRRRRGETAGFRSAARGLLRPIIRLPGFSQTIVFLNDTLPWLHLWEWNETAEHDFTKEPGGREENHLSPHP